MYVGAILGSFMALFIIDKFGYHVAFGFISGVMLVQTVLYAVLCGSVNKTAQSDGEIEIAKND